MKKLCWANLPALDHGKIAAAFDREIEHVIRDCMDRPNDERPRRVAVVFTINPTEVDKEEQQIDCEKVGVACEITSQVPKRRTKTYTMSVKQDGSAGFAPSSPEDPEQQELYDEEKEKE